MKTRLYDGDTFEREGYTFKFEGKIDECSDAPWENMDTLGEVTDWTNREKMPGERLLNSDHGSKRYYDFAGAVAKARKEGCDDGKPGTKRQKAARVVEAEYEYLRRWCNDEWHYMGVIVTLLDEDGEETETSESLWGIEDDADEYHVEVAEELADEIISKLRKESAERDYMARMDQATA